jgi:hypothetical protein
MDQRLESTKEETKIIFAHASSDIQTLTDMVQRDKSESFESQIKRQSSPVHSDGDVEKPAILATQTHTATSQGFVVSQEKRASNSDDSTDQAEETLLSTDELNSAGSGLHGCDGMASSSTSQVIYGDLAEIPRTGIESEDITQQCGDQSCVAQPQPQYGTEDDDVRETTELCGNNSDANSQHLPTASDKNYG